MLRKSVIGLYLLTELVMPIVAAVYLQFNPPDSFSNWAGLMHAQRLVFCFAALPAYAVYAWLVITAHFPTTRREIAMLFVPVGWAVISSVWLWPEESLWELIVFEGIPFYVALNILLGVGLIWLVLFKEPDESQGLQKLAALGLLALLLLLLFGPAACVFWMGWELCTDINTSGLASGLSYGDYLLSIGLAVVFTFPIVKSLYQKGAL